MRFMNQSILLGVGEVAKRLGKSKATIRRMAQSGRLPTAGTVGERNILVFDRDAIEKMAREGSK